MRVARISMGFAYPIGTSGIKFQDPAMYASVITYNNTVQSGHHSAGVGPIFTVIAPDSNFNLPVELLLFTGNYVTDQVTLNWKTATETNSYGYDIERSDHSAAWERIGFVPSHGTTTAAQDYTFVDRNLPVVPELSYRLKMTDMDGSYTYSQVLKIPITVLPGSPQLQALYPNPTSQDVFVNFRLPRDAVISVTLYDSRGREMRRMYKEELLGAGSYVHKLDVSGLAGGTYFVRMDAGKYSEAKSVVIR